MALQLLDTTAGAGDSGKVGGDKVNRNILELASLARSARVAIIANGDSKGGELSEAMRWVAYEEGLSLRFEPGIFIGSSNSGTSNTAPKGLTSTDRMAADAATISALTSAGVTVDMCMTMGTNDITAGFTPEQSVANIRKYFEQVFRANGGRYFWLAEIDPRVASDTDTGARIASFNRLIYSLEWLYSDIIVVPTHDVLLDPDAANANGNPFPYTFTTGSAPLGAFTRDGLHCSVRGNYEKRRAVQAMMRKAYRPKRTLNLSKAGVRTTNTVASKYGRQTGVNGRTTALGGTNSATNGTVTGTPPNNTTFSGNLQGLSVTFETSTITIAADGGPIPRGTWPTVKMSISGTPTADVANMNIGITGQAGSMAVGDQFAWGALMYREALTGLMGIKVEMNQAGSISGANNVLIGQDVSAGSLSQSLPAMTGSLIVERDPATLTATFSAYTLSTYLYFASGVPVFGAMHFLSLFGEQVAPLPAAAP